MEKQLYRLDEVAKILGICRNQVYNLRNDGYLQGHNKKPGSKGLRITRQSIEEYIKLYKETPNKF